MILIRFNSSERSDSRAIPESEMSARPRLWRDSYVVSIRHLRDDRKRHVPSVAKNILHTKMMRSDPAQPRIFGGQQFTCFSLSNHGEYGHVYSSLAVALAAEQDRNPQTFIRRTIGNVLPYCASWQFGFVLHVVPFINQHHQRFSTPEGVDDRITDIRSDTGDSSCESDKRHGSNRAWR